MGDADALDLGACFGGSIFQGKVLGLILGVDLSWAVHEKDYDTYFGFIDGKFSI
jgi:hypothetical protein